MMKTGVIAFFIYSIFCNLSFAQVDGQDALFQKYQAMVIVEEANQHCPLLSKLEAEVLNGQIVFANSTFSGKLDRVEKFKKEARIFARRSACNAPEILELVGLARQEASDSMINHLLLARQIHILDELASDNKVIARGLLLDFLIEDEWKIIDELHDEVKNNYLSRATDEDWQKFEASIIKVAEDRTAEKYLTNENLLKNGQAQRFDTVQATANNRDITTYYYHLEKSVKAFIEGANASKTGYPYSRPANDFTNWTAFRPRNGDLNWVMSYPGCGGALGEIECTLFINMAGEIGLVLNSDVESVSLEFRNPNNHEFNSINNSVEGPIGSNELNEKNLNDNLEAMLTSNDKVLVTA